MHPRWILLLLLLVAVGVLAWVAWPWAEEDGEQPRAGQPGQDGTDPELLNADGEKPAVPSAEAAALDGRDGKAAGKPELRSVKRQRPSAYHADAARIPALDDGARDNSPPLEHSTASPRLVIAKPTMIKTWARKNLADVPYSVVLLEGVYPPGVQFDLRVHVLDEAGGAQGVQVVPYVRLSETAIVARIPTHASGENPRLRLAVALKRSGEEVSEVVLPLIQAARRPGYAMRTVIRRLLGWPLGASAIMRAHSARVDAGMNRKTSLREVRVQALAIKALLERQIRKLESPGPLGATSAGCQKSVPGLRPSCCTGWPARRAGVRS